MPYDRFLKLAMATVAATLFLIFIGGLVRATGAGLGCPDWPKCFGVWIPPTSAADLPAGYDAADFNAVKTWTEYVNRLIGVLIGLLITATALSSLRFRKSNPVVTYSSAGAFVLVLFQGWLGGMVVRSGLHEGLITAHMLLAMVIVGLLMLGTFKASARPGRWVLPAGTRSWLTTLSLVLLVISLVQMGLGTQVREHVDVAKNAMPPVPRAQWLEGAGWIDGVHRSFSWVVLVAVALLMRAVRRPDMPAWVRKWAYAVAGLVGLQIAAGIGLAYLEMPAPLQVVHLSGAAGLVSAVFVLLLTVREATEQPT